MRVVFDTNTVVSALLFANGQLGWLRAHWQSQRVTPLASRDTVDELVRVLAYPKFELQKSEIEALLADYLPFAEAVQVTADAETPQCRDPDDQMFVDLAIQGNADILVTGDKALLEMEIAMTIETPADYKARQFQGSD